MFVFSPQLSQEHILGFVTCFYEYVLVKRIFVLMITELLNPCHTTHLVSKDISSIVLSIKFFL
jgi:hypothetical protein